MTYDYLVSYSPIESEPVIKRSYSPLKTVLRLSLFQSHSESYCPPLKPAAMRMQQTWVQGAQVLTVVADSSQQAYCSSSCLYSPAAAAVFVVIVVAVTAVAVTVVVRAVGSEDGPASGDSSSQTVYLAFQCSSVED